jgi:hypothetical protein
MRAWIALSATVLLAVLYAAFAERGLLAFERGAARAWRSLPVIRIARYLPFAGAFLCFWFAADYRNVAPFSEPHWRLLGWTLLAIGAALVWRGRARDGRP